MSSLRCIKSEVPYWALLGRIFCEYGFLVIGKREKLFGDELEDDYKSFYALKDGIEKALNTLAPKERKVLELRVGIEGVPKTLREVGDILEVSPERIRQIEAKALRKMKHPSRKRIIYSVPKEISL